LQILRKQLVNLVWKHLASFSCLVFIGCVSGALAWSTNIPAQTLYYNARDPARIAIATQQRSILFLLYDHAQWVSIFLVAHGLETSCMAMAEMLVLGRLVKHAQGATQLAAARRVM
jgi:hypothetical protein